MTNKISAVSQSELDRGMNWVIKNSYNKGKKEARHEVICGVIFFTILAVGTISYMTWYGQKTMEASLTVNKE